MSRSDCDIEGVRLHPRSSRFLRNKRVDFKITFEGRPISLRHRSRSSVGDKSSELRQLGSSRVVRISLISTTHGVQG